MVDAFLFTTTGMVHYTPYVQTRTFPSPNSSIPTITATFAYYFTARGSFSADNPITVSVIISDVNTTNLLQYYGELGFWGSVLYSSKSQYIGGEEQNGYIFLKQAPDGSYRGTATLIWPIESVVFTYLLPVPALFSSSVSIGAPNNSTQSVSTLTISSSQDTFNWQFDDLATKLTLIVIAFSLLMLQPILEAVFQLKKDD